MKFTVDFVMNPLLSRDKYVWTEICLSFVRDSRWLEGPNNYLRLNKLFRRNIWASVGRKHLHSLLSPSSAGGHNAVDERPAALRSNYRVATVDHLLEIKVSAGPRSPGEAVEVLSRNLFEAGGFISS